MPSTSESVTIDQCPKIFTYFFNMTITTNEHGQTNVFAKEPIMYVTEEDMRKHERQPYAVRAEILNSQWAIIGIICALISYTFTGKLFFGIW